MMSFNLGQKGIPLWSGFSANHQEVGAIFAPEVLAVVKADTLPALVGKNILERGVAAPNELDSEFRGSIHGSGAGVACVFTHFNPKGFSVSGALVSRVLPLLVCPE